MPIQLRPALPYYSSGDALATTSLLCLAPAKLNRIVDPLSILFRAGRPDPVTNCSVANITFDMVSIVCVEGFNGGLLQQFRAEVFTSDFQHHIQTVRSRWVCWNRNWLVYCESNSSQIVPSLPRFEIRNLQSGVNYGIGLFAFNDKGESDVARVPIYTLKNPEKQTDLMPKVSLIEDIRPFLPIIMGASGGLVLMGALIILAMRMRGPGNDRDINTVNSSCANRTPPSDHHLHNGNYLGRLKGFISQLIS